MTTKPPTALDTRLADMEGTLKSLVGQALQFDNKGNALPLRLGDPITIGSEIQISENGSIVVVFPDGTIIWFGAESKFSISEFQYDAAQGNFDLVLSIIEGTFVIRGGVISTANPAGILIQAPETVASIRYGTFAGKIGGPGEPNLFSLLNNLDGSTGLLEVQSGASNHLIILPRQTLLIGEPGHSGSSLGELSFPELSSLYGGLGAAIESLLRLAQDLTLVPAAGGPVSPTLLDRDASDNEAPVAPIPELPDRSGNARTNESILILVGLNAGDLALNSDDPAESNIATGATGEGGSTEEFEPDSNENLSGGNDTNTSGGMIEDEFAAGDSGGGPTDDGSLSGSGDAGDDGPVDGGGSSDSVDQGNDNTGNTGDDTPSSGGSNGGSDTGQDTGDGNGNEPAPVLQSFVSLDAALGVGLPGGGVFPAESFLFLFLEGGFIEDGSGGTGDDNFVFARNDGFLEISDPGGTDTLGFREDLNGIEFLDDLSSDFFGNVSSYNGLLPVDLDASWSGTDLILTDAGSGATIIIQDQIGLAGVNPRFAIDQFLFISAQQMGFLYPSTGLNEVFQLVEQFVQPLPTTSDVIVYNFTSPQNPTNLDDFIVGFDNADTISGAEGSDIIYGSLGGDILSGDSGLDYLSGGFGDDTLLGGADTDILSGGEGNDVLNGGEGEDIASYFGATSGVEVDLSQGMALESHGDTDTLFGIEHIRGSLFDDRLLGNESSNTILGLAGSDFIDGDTGNDRLFGGAGEDMLFGGLGEDFLFGEAGDDELYGGDDNDSLFGSFGADTLSGGAGNDFLVGGTGSDNLFGDDGDDTLIGVGVPLFVSLLNPITYDFDSDVDTLFGGAGNDRIFGEGGDLLYGEDGDDRLFGPADMLWGGPGDDFLSALETSEVEIVIFVSESGSVMFGEEGNDILLGGTGIDFLIGGSGNDFYIYKRVLVDSVPSETEFDRIVDASGELDILGFDNTITNFLTQPVFEPTINGLSALQESKEVSDPSSLGLAILLPDTLSFTRIEEDLVVSDLGNNGQFIGGVVVENHYTEDGRIEYFQFSAIPDEIFFFSDPSNPDQGGAVLNDLIVGEDQEGTEGEVLSGGDGLDIIYGNEGNDTLHGESGNDFLIGGTGDDSLYGGDGDNLLSGGDGNDLLISESVEGRDIMTGGAGSDTFVWGSAALLSGQADLITDFEAGADSIDINGILSDLPNGMELSDHLRLNSAEEGTELQISVEGTSFDTLVLFENLFDLDLEFLVG